MRLAGFILIILAIFLVATAYANSRAPGIGIYVFPLRSSRAARLVFHTDYAPPFPAPSSSWYLRTPVSDRERRRQSLCCTMLPVMCGKPTCTVAAVLYTHTYPKHLSRSYLEPFRREPDPGQEVRSTIFWAMNPIPKVRYDFLPVYKLFVFGDDTTKP